MPVRLTSSNAAVSPAVEPDRALIRTSLMATHTVDQLRFALDVMHAVGVELGVLAHAGPVGERV